MEVTWKWCGAAFSDLPMMDSLVFLKVPEDQWNTSPFWLSPDSVSEHSEVISLMEDMTWISTPYCCFRIFSLRKRQRLPQPIWNSAWKVSGRICRLFLNWLRCDLGSHGRNHTVLCVVQRFSGRCARLPGVSFRSESVRLCKEGWALQRSLHRAASLNICSGRAYEGISTIIVKISWSLCRHLHCYWKEDKNQE